jgi:hypothetical protein
MHDVLAVGKLDSWIGVYRRPGWWSGGWAAKRGAPAWDAKRAKVKLEGCPLVLEAAG